MTTTLITGAAGFVGGYLTAACADRGDRVIGYDTRIRGGDNVRDYERLRSVIERENPDYIFHLAAQAYVAESLTDPRRAMEVNTGGTHNLLEAVRNTGCQAKILLAGTSEEYGYENQPGPTVIETSPTIPTTAYGVSKLAATTLGMVYHRQHGLHVVATRAYNHTGPGRPAVYADSAFALRVARAAAGGEPVRHGNLDAIRNYTDVRDVVAAYLLAVDTVPGIYNICSDQNVTMRHILDLLIKASGANVETVKDGALWRLSGSTTWHNPLAVKLQALTGWAPTYTLEQTLTDVYTYWSDRL